MESGPMFKPDQIAKFNAKEISEEDIEEITSQNEILAAHKQWAEKHFESANAKEPPDKPKIRI